MEQLPRSAAWRFVDAVDGFEVVYTAPGELRGHTSAVENGKPYAVHHDIRFDEEWRTREVVVSADTVAGALQVKLTSDGAGSWTVNDQPRPDLDGLVDIDLEASACTNTLPVHRLHLAAVRQSEPRPCTSKRSTSPSGGSTRPTAGSTPTQPIRADRGAGLDSRRRRCQSGRCGPP